MVGSRLSSTQQGRQRFAAALQSALTLAEVQRAFLDAAGDAIHASAFGLYRLDPQTRTMIDFRARVDGDFLDEYEEYGRPDDPVLRFVLSQNRPIDSSRLSDRDCWPTCGARCAIAIGGYEHSLEAPVIVSGGLFGTINFARVDAAPQFSDLDLVSARVVGEQLGLATERALRYEHTGQRASTLEHVLDRIPQAVLITDLDAQVIFSNRAARIGDHDRPVPRELVEGSIAEAMRLFRTQRKRVHTQTAWDQASRRDVIVKSYRLPDHDYAALTMVFACAPQGSARLPAWDALSKREQEIAELVSQGLTNKQIAERAFVSENTVKQHLKRVFSKTDVRNRAELMQRIWAARSPQPGTAGVDDPDSGDGGPAADDETAAQ